MRMHKVWDAVVIMRDKYRIDTHYPSDQHIHSKDKVFNESSHQMDTLRMAQLENNTKWEIKHPESQVKWHLRSIDLAPA
jgi:hypothetical protein